ncbi:hypothetical protein DFJ74DRAFT_644085 [Hyaloraphidium curvatum]|nr:hypothetical protein DFJ74DRAFT_644085 [Hyaloraphidium curvatum]
MGLGGIYYVATLTKRTAYVFPSDLLRKLMFMFGPIQAPLTLIGALLYWGVRRLEGDTSIIGIFTHGIAVILVICDFFVLQRLPLVWGNLWVMQGIVLGYTFLAWIIQAFCESCRFTFWDSDNNGGFAINIPSNAIAWIGLILLLCAYALSFFAFLWFIRWRDNWGKKVQRKKLKDVHVPDEEEGWEVFDESNPDWKPVLDGFDQYRATGAKGTLERSAKRMLTDPKIEPPPETDWGGDTEVAGRDQKPEEESNQWWQSWFLTDHEIEVNFTGEQYREALTSPAPVESVPTSPPAALELQKLRGMLLGNGALPQSGVSLVASPVIAEALAPLPTVPPPAPKAAAPVPAPMAVSVPASKPVSVPAPKPVYVPTPVAIVVRHATADYDSDDPPSPAPASIDLGPHTPASARVDPVEPVTAAEAMPEGFEAQSEDNSSISIDGERSDADGVTVEHSALNGQAPVNGGSASTAAEPMPGGFEKPPEDRASLSIDGVHSELDEDLTDDADDSGDGDTDSGFESPSESVSDIGQPERFVTAPRVTRAGTATKVPFPTMKSQKISETVPHTGGAGHDEPAPGPSVWNRFTNLFFSAQPVPVEPAAAPGPPDTPSYKRSEQFFDPLEEAPRKLNATLQRSSTWFKGWV